MDANQKGMNIAPRVDNALNLAAINHLFCQPSINIHQTILLFPQSGELSRYVIIHHGVIFTFLWSGTLGIAYANSGSCCVRERNKSIDGRKTVFVLV